MPTVWRLPLTRLRDLRITASRGFTKRALTLPSVAVTDLFEAGLHASLFDVGLRNGNTSLLEQVLITALARARGCRRFFELGTFDGTTSANVAAGLEGGEVLTIDLPAGRVEHVRLPVSAADQQYILKDEIGAKLRHLPPGAATVTQLLCDTATFDFSPYHSSCDMVFVDASHQYEYVINDSTVACELTRPGGTILWHDYGNLPGVTAALGHLRESDIRFRELQAIDETTLAILEPGLAPPTA